MVSPPSRSLEQAFGGAILRVEHRSITTVEADVLVSSDDTDLSMSGGASLALLDAGGKAVFLEAQELAPLPLGGVAVTTAGKLHASKIFHAVVLDHAQGPRASVELIRSVTRTCLSKCDRLDLDSICFPALATAMGGLSPERSAFAMLMEIAAHLAGPTGITTVSIALFAPFGVDRSEAVARFFDQASSFFEVCRRFPSTASAIEAVEQAYQKLDGRDATVFPSSFWESIREPGLPLDEEGDDIAEQEVVATERGGAERVRDEELSDEPPASDLYRPPPPPEPITLWERMPAPAASSPIAPAPQRLDIPGHSAPSPAPSTLVSHGPPPSPPKPVVPAKSSAMHEPQKENKPSRERREVLAPSAAPVDWRAIELRCKEERRGMLRALVAIRERDLVQLELNAALDASSIDEEVTARAQQRLSWSKQQLDQLDEELGSSGVRVALAASTAPAAGSAPERLSILHLSDLHFGTEANAQSWYEQLTADLTRELGCERLDCAVLSGDIANRSTKAEYAAAKSFLDKLCQRFSLSKSRLVIVPGNHDINWPLSEKAYTVMKSKDYKGPRSDGRVIDKGEYLEARVEAKYLRRMDLFRAFYEAVKGERYPADHADQATIHAFPDLGLVFLGLNSAWQLDHHFTRRAGIDPRALTAALEQLDRDRATHSDCHKIAVLHHPLSSEYEDRIKDHGFMERLAVAGFRLTLHGHIHKAQALPFHYDHTAGGRKIDVIAAGTFGAPVNEWVPGHPLQYNLLRLEGRRLTVETRRREELEGAWKPDARWLRGAGKDPLPRYEIEL